MLVVIRGSESIKDAVDDILDNTRIIEANTEGDGKRRGATGSAHAAVSEEGTPAPRRYHMRVIKNGVGAHAAMCDSAQVGEWLNIQH